MPIPNEARRSPLLRSGLLPLLTRPAMTNELLRGCRTAGKMQMQITTQSLLPYLSGRIALPIAQLREAERSHSLVLPFWFLFYREMEFMTMQGLPGHSQHRWRLQFSLDIADHLQFLRHHRLASKNANHRMRVPIKIDKSLHEIHVAAALRINRHPAPGSLPD